MTGTTAQIPLSQDRMALVDAEDYRRLSQFNWWWMPNKRGGYACRQIRFNGKRLTIYMHRVIMGLYTQNNLQIDHANGDGLDNRRENLRVCSVSENLANRITPPRTGACATAYRGVYKLERSGRIIFQAAIKVNGKRRHLGCRSSPKEAALLYDVAAKEAFSDFARLNFPRAEQAP